MKQKFIIFHLFLIGFCLSCSSPEEKLPPESFSKIEELKGSVIKTKDKLLIPTKIKIINDSIVATLSPVIFPALKIYNINTGELIAQAAHQGNGPNELIFPSMLTKATNNSGLLEVFDGNRQRKFQYELDSLLNNPNLYQGSIIDDFPTIPGYIFQHSVINDEIIGCGMFTDGRFIRISDENEISYFGEYPESGDQANMESTVLSNAYQGLIKPSPDETKFVYLSTYGGVMEIYNLDADAKITKSAQKIDYLPKFFQLDEGEHQAMIVSNECPFGYIDAVTTNNHIYTIYSGRSPKKYGNENAYCEHLLVYDWEGKPTKGFKLDMPICCFDIVNDILYGIALMPEPQFVTYKLPKL